MTVQCLTLLDCIDNKYITKSYCYGTIIKDNLKLISILSFIVIIYLVHYTFTYCVLTLHIYNKMPGNNKRERNVNFSCEETALLLKLVNDNIHIVENKKSDAATWTQKENCWKSIEASFNLASSVRYRSAKSLKMKYEAYKRDLKKKTKFQTVVCKPEEDSMSDAILSLKEEIVKNVTVYPVPTVEFRLDSDEAHQTGKHISISIFFKIVKVNHILIIPIL